MSKMKKNNKYTPERKKLSQMRNNARYAIKQHQKLKDPTLKQSVYIVGIVARENYLDLLIMKMDQAYEESERPTGVQMQRNRPERREKQ